MALLVYILFFQNMQACFSGMHYVCFILQDDVWVMFNDSKVKVTSSSKSSTFQGYVFHLIADLHMQAIGSWLDMVSACVAGGWKPTLVFFQSAASSSRLA
jgi:hypothetical protein